MATYKVTYKFNHNSGKGRPFGWSESYYYTSNSTSSLNGLISGHGYRRLALLTQRTSLVSVSRYDVSKPYSVEQKSVGAPGNWVGKTDTAWQSLLMIETSASGNVKRWEMRAIPDGQIDDGDFVPTDTFQPLLQAFIDGYTGQQNPYQLRGLDRTLPVIPVVSITTAGLVSTTQAHGLVAGDTINFFKTKTKSGSRVTGNFVVQTPPSPVTVPLVGWPTGEEVDKGYLRKRALTYVNVDQISASRITSRKTGRPFGLTRGRR